MNNPGVVSEEREPDFLHESYGTATGPSLTDAVEFRLSATAEEMDEAWAGGWRHFGPVFFRTLVSVYEDELLNLQALRVVVSRFEASKSQRRVLRRNADLQIAFEPARITNELYEMFGMHARRFASMVPENLEHFLGPTPGTVPCQTLTLAVRAGSRLVAASFLDIGKTSVSSVYGMFDPAESRRSLGIFTMLEEIAYARRLGFQYYYPGYASKEHSAYDYKKQFAGLEYFDWKGHWHAANG